MQLNMMFENIFWQLGRSPKMVFNKEIKRLDIVADTILDTPAISNTKVKKLTIYITLFPEKIEDGFELHGNDISCWDIINKTNDWFYDNLDRFQYYIATKMIIDEHGIVKIIAEKLLN